MSTRKRQTKQPAVDPVLAARARLANDFPAYAEAFLRIRAKSGAIVPLVLNRAQRYVHGRFEAQRERTGRVRALLLKGRQQGMSTYVGGRYYHRTTNQGGVSTFILTHEMEATANLFKMVERFHTHMHPHWQPRIGASNRRELLFDNIDSGYRIGTAGTKGVGRSATVQLFHGSEVAFWPHASDHAAGVLQAVPNEPGTEVILESTASGMGNYFHTAWVQAVAGMSEFEAVFVPWYWQDEYRAHVHEGFVLEDEEAEYQRLYGLDLEQIAWRRAKIVELRGDHQLFKQEYPATAEEAFQVTGVESYLPADAVLRARRYSVSRTVGPHLVGCDPARMGDDRTCFIHRQGREVFGIETHRKIDGMAVAGLCVRILREATNPVKKLFIDVGGMGAPIYDRLVELGYGSRVIPVNFGSRAAEADRYPNRRGEMYGRLREWLTDPAGVSIPDSDALHADLTALAVSKWDSLSRPVLERKEQVKARLGASPDLADALALTFAEHVFDDRSPYAQQYDGGRRYDPMEYR